MGKHFITSVAIAALLASTPGCFTIAGGVIGGAGDPPPGAPHKPDTGMSGGAKGVLVGAILDVALISATAYSFTQMHWNLGPNPGPDSD